MTKTIVSVKVGAFRIPSLRLDILLKVLTIIYEKNLDNVFSSEKLLKDIDIKSEKSSSLSSKTKELKKFGLIEGRLEKFRITDLGKRIVQFNNPQREKDVETAIKYIPLWNIFLSAGGKTISDEKVIEILKNMAKLEDKEARERAPEIKRAFLRDIDCIRFFMPGYIYKSTETAPELPPQQPNLNPEIPPLSNLTQTGQPEINSSILHNREKSKMSIDYGMLHVEILDESSLKLAYKLLKAMEKELQIRGMSLETKSL
ncbi:MAG: hypothetical protein Q7V05_07340 [Methanoregula sp.]|nr:hypothetical protein [Methanoregula sp.]